MTKKTLLNIKKKTQKATKKKSTKLKVFPANKK